MASQSVGLGQGLGFGVAVGTGVGVFVGVGVRVAVGVGVGVRVHLCVQVGVGVGVRVGVAVRAGVGVPVHVGVGVQVGLGVGVAVGVGVGVAVGVGVGVAVGVGVPTTVGWVTWAVRLTHWDVKAPKVGVIARIPSTMVITVPSSLFDGMRRCAAIPLSKLATERESALILRHPNAAELAAMVVATSTVTTPASTRPIARMRAFLVTTLHSRRTARMSMKCDLKVTKTARPIAATSTAAIAVSTRHTSSHPQSLSAA